MSGQISYLAGLAAEEQVARHYERLGHALCRARWRGKQGEIDLIMHDGDGFVFVEVKKSRDFARAVERITSRQLHRIHAAASEFLADAPRGLDTPSRIDVALVNGLGAIRIVENAFGH